VRANYSLELGEQAVEKKDANFSEITDGLLQPSIENV